MKDVQIEEREFLELLGARVRDFRKALGISQEQLAELTNLHPTHIYKIENAKTNASITVCARIASALRVPLPLLVEPPGERANLDEAVAAVKLLDERNQHTVAETLRGLLNGLQGKVRK